QSFLRANIFMKSHLTRHFGSVFPVKGNPIEHVRKRYFQTLRVCFFSSSFGHVSLVQIEESMSNFAVYDTTIRRQPEGLPTFLDIIFIFAEIGQSLSAIFVKDGAAWIGSFT